MEQRPAVIPQLLNIWRAVGGQDWDARAGTWRASRLVFGVYLRAECAGPVGGLVAGPASKKTLVRHTSQEEVLVRDNDHIRFAIRAQHHSWR